MSSRSLVVIELPEGSCSPQVLETILRQVREFFDRLSSGLNEFTGQRLRVTIGPWEVQHRELAGDCSVEVPQSSQNNVSTPTPTTYSPGRFARPFALEASSAQDGGMHTLVQRQGLDGQALIGGSRGLEERSAQVVGLEDDNIVFPNHNARIPSYATSPPFAGQSPFYGNPPQGVNIDPQPLQSSHQLLRSNNASPSKTQQNEVGPRTSDEALIRQAANNLYARPVSELAIPHGEIYPRLQWETPSAPADYLTPGPGGLSGSRPASRKRG